MIAALLQVSQKAKQLSLITIISSIISLLIMVVLVINIKDKIFAYMFSFFLGSIVNFIIFMLYSYKYFSIKAKDKKIFKYIKYSGVRLPVDLSAWIVTFADRLMLYDLKGESESGIYSIGYKIGSGIEVITNAINKAYVPFAFNQLKKDSDLNNLSSKVLNFYTLYFFITFTIIMFSKEIVALLAPSYKESLGVIVIILFSYLINGLKSLFQVPMDFKIEFVKIKSILWLTSAFVNVFLNLLFIPKYSYTGAAVATFFSYLIIFLPILYFSDKATKVKYPIKEMLVVLFLSLSILPFFMLNLSIFNFLIKLLVLMIYYILLSKVINKNLIGILRMLK